VLNLLRRLWPTQKPLAEMTPKEVGEHLARRFPMTVRYKSYNPPQHRCSRWILVNGPVYAGRNFFGTVIVEASTMADWMTEHAQRVFSSNIAEQQAREFLPTWLSNADATDDSVTLLDEQQREVLQGDCLRFLWSDWAKLWCPTCKSWHPRIKEHDFGWAQTGKMTLRFDDWHCPAGHLIHKENHEKIRSLRR